MITTFTSSIVASVGARLPLVFSYGNGAVVTPPTQRGNIAYNQIRALDRQGNGPQFQMGGLGGHVAGHVPIYDTQGNLIDSGSAPATGTITSLTGEVTASGSGAVAATVVKIPPGVTLTGTPSVGWVPTATSSSAATWQAVAGSGTVTTTGSPASGNLTKFSGATSITNGDLSGDVTTSGTLAVTAVKIPPGVTLTGTPAVGQVPTATSSSAATWQNGYPVPTTITPSGVASATITSVITSAYRDYELRLSDITFSGVNHLTMQVSTDNGSTWDTAATYYNAYHYTSLTSAGDGFSHDAGVVGFNVIWLSPVASNKASGCSARYTLFNPLSATLQKRMMGQLTQEQNSDNNTYVITMGFVYDNINAINALKFIATAGTFSGTITLQPLPQ